MFRVAILASGSGTNAQRLIEYFKTSDIVEVKLVGCDKPHAGVLRRAWDLGIPSYLFNGALLNDGTVLNELQGQRIDLIILAGFLRLIPKEIVAAFPDRIVNIHPSLLPEYGGKGMYGEHVHRAVIASGEEESGITIHLVNEQYDQGKHLLQIRCSVLPSDTPETLAERIHRLEHEHYPKIVEVYLGQVEKALVGQGPKA
ncbi:MAG: phosphoribosylglycinamide formyltransferase [Flavobacteriales bacterium]